MYKDGITPAPYMSDGPDDGADELTADFICKMMGKLWDEPCNYGWDEYDFALLMTDKDNGEWCNAHCTDKPNHDPAACWKRLFELLWEMKKDA